MFEMAVEWYMDYNRRARTTVPQFALDFVPNKCVGFPRDKHAGEISNAPVFLFSIARAYPCRERAHRKAHQQGRATSRVRHILGVSYRRVMDGHQTAPPHRLRNGRNLLPRFYCTAPCRTPYLTHNSKQIDAETGAWFYNG